jgi:phosphopantothenoylcysteine decarboxylase/phosphopantothenate--cysteine ligase
VERGQHRGKNRRNAQNEAEKVALSAKKQLRFLVTAGPTREFFDPVRFVSNRSSGKMGYALAEAAAKISKNVTLISGPTALDAPKNVKLVRVNTAQEMHDAVLSRIDACDILLMSAAVCDVRPKKFAKSKLEKANLPKILELERTPDVLLAAKKRKKNQIFVGFAAETHDVLEHARAKLARKGLDLIVANDVTRADAGFEADTNIVTILSRDGSSETLPKMTKKALAGEIVKRAVRLAS